MLQNREGKRIPSVTFRTRREHEWVDIRSDELFAGKTVVVFSLPGAFTPTCSSAHVPRYNDLADALKANGVDEIVCMSVNDGFVMSEWQIEQKADQLTFIPDGNGEFTAGMGLLVDKAELGFGQRSWRYSMLVKDGVIVKQFIEPEIPGDPYEVSDADTMLDYINPQAKKPHDVLILTKKGCPFCVHAKGMLRENGYRFEELVLGSDLSLSAVRAASGADTVPQVFIDGEFIGDSGALARYFGEAGDIAA